MEGRGKPSTWLPRQKLAEVEHETKKTREQRKAMPKLEKQNKNTGEESRIQRGEKIIGVPIKNCRKNSCKIKSIAKHGTL